MWFGEGLLLETPDDYLEGNPQNRMMASIIMFAGLTMLLKRKLDWGKIFASNRWLFAFFLYCGISAIWSDYSFVSFKRWIKDIGNLIIVLIILTENNPFMALKAVFARFTYITIPLSVVFIKYFPELGRYYNQWTWELGYSGVTTGKNALGSIVFICALFLIWDLIEMRSASIKKIDKVDLSVRILLLSMVFWLFSKADSQTALTCFILGTGILLLMQFPLATRHVRYLGTYSLSIGILILLLYVFPAIFETIVGLLGRDMTLTGRTDLWAELLRVPINPLLGTGYQSFWLGPVAEHFWEIYYFHPNQAHNGYLETYLNGGLVGVCLLMAMIISTGRNLKKKLLMGNSDGILLFSFLVVAMFYNLTEASFSRMSLVWIVLLFTALNHPHSSKSNDEKIVQIAK